MHLYKKSVPLHTIELPYKIRVRGGGGYTCYPNDYESPPGL